MLDHNGVEQLKNWLNDEEKDSSFVIFQDDTQKILDDTMNHLGSQSFAMWHVNNHFRYIREDIVLITLNKMQRSGGYWDNGKWHSAEDK